MDVLALRFEPIHKFYSHNFVKTSMSFPFIFVLRGQKFHLTVPTPETPEIKQLGGGFNPSEILKNISQNGSFPQFSG